jgi:hypothetical protein
VKDLQFIDALLPDLPLVADGQLYCFQTGGDPLKTFTLKHSQDATNAICVSDVKNLIRQTAYSSIYNFKFISNYL